MTYTTVSGDMWDSISYKIFGTCNYTDKIIDANRDFINTFIFPANVELNLPDIEPEKKRSASCPPWRR
jgi:phage tail protein X